MREQMRSLLSRVLGIDPGTLPHEPTPELVEQWDSLHHMELMVALEEELGIEIDPELAPALVSLTALVELAERTRAAV